MNHLVTEGGEWAGAPFPVNGLPLMLEKRYPFQELQGKTLESFEQDRLPEALDRDDIKVRNSWYSDKHHAKVYVCEAFGRIFAFKRPLWGGTKLDLWFNTMMAARAWTVEAELRALAKLKEMIPPHLYEAYFLTGTFLETSKRTGIIYVFRRLRPTVALRGDGESIRILSTLCLHPIGYYGNSFGGVMTPTDDVIAHLMLMRGDEAFFWRKANHHESWEPEAGL